MTNLSRRDFWTTLLAMFGIGATAGVEWDVLTSGNDKNGGEFGVIKDFGFVETLPRSEAGFARPRGHHGR